MSFKDANYFRSFHTLSDPASFHSEINSPRRNRMPYSQRALLRLLKHLLNTNQEKRKWKK